MPNATRQALEIAGAKHERRLFPVACTRLLDMDWDGSPALVSHPLFSSLFVDFRLVDGLRNNFQGRTICEAVNVEIAIQGEQTPHTQMLGGGDNRRIGSIHRCVAIRPHQLDHAVHCSAREIMEEQPPSGTQPP